MKKERENELKAARSARRLEALAQRDPRNLLRISGTGVYRDVLSIPISEPNHYAAQKLHLAANTPESLLVWQGDGITTIDRFDARNELGFLAPADIGPEINLDPADDSTQTTSAHSHLQLSRDEAALENSLNFERFRDLLENDVALKRPEAVISFIDTYWNDLYLMRPEERTKPRSMSHHTAPSEESLEQLVAELTSEETILDLIPDLNASNIDSLNVIGKQYSIENAYGYFKSELESASAAPGKKSKKRDRGASSRQSFRGASRNRNNSSSDSSSSSSEDEPPGNSSFVLEFETTGPSDDAMSPGTTDRTSTNHSTAMADSEPVLPIHLRVVKPSKFSRNIAESEWERRSLDTGGGRIASSVVRMDDEDEDVFGLKESVVADEKSEVLFKKRKTGTLASQKKRVAVAHRSRSASPELDEFGRTVRK
ncbi:hypothetical protein HDU98_006787 [Podochytrium sp. JEL0797]|nr:hypothetical protein HDU98_006787 [Podochytrium sp. JEL0797]